MFDGYSSNASTTCIIQFHGTIQTRDAKQQEREIHTCIEHNTTWQQESKQMSILLKWVSKLDDNKVTHMNMSNTNV
jgi:hypothetical protein